MSETTRRAVFSRAALTGAAAVLAQVAAWVRPAGATPSASPAGSGPDAAEAAPGPVIARTRDIPVGGGVVIEDKYVVTRPRKNVFRAFSAVCTHQGCPVADVRNGTINCPCHGSRFAITDGSVLEGPAERPSPGRGSGSPRAGSASPERAARPGRTRRPGCPCAPGALSGKRNFFRIREPADTGPP